MTVFRKGDKVRFIKHHKTTKVGRIGIVAGEPRHPKSNPYISVIWENGKNKNQWPSEYFEKIVED